jgi:hypothetical protein
MAQYDDLALEISKALWSDDPRASDLPPYGNDYWNCYNRQADKLCQLMVRHMAAVAPSGCAQADEIRALGWQLEIHTDSVEGEWYTTWLFTRFNRFIKGVGKTDAEALADVLAQIKAQQANSQLS